MATDAGLFFNRELSWLEFNQRVLDEAMAPDVPLLDRVNFLSITASNLDEFFMVRVGGLKHLKRTKARRKDIAELTPTQQLFLVGERTQKMVADQHACYAKGLAPALASAGINRLNPQDLRPAQTRHVEDYFEERVFPVVTPMAVRRMNDFPLLPSLAIVIAARLKPKRRRKTPLMGIIPIGPKMDRFVGFPSEEGYGYLLIEDVIRLNVGRLFPGQEVQECFAFRITRNADMSVQEDMAADLLAGMEDVLAWRKSSDCVRLEIDAKVSRESLDYLQRVLRVDADSVYRVPGMLDMSGLRRLAELPGYDGLRYESWPPQASPEIDLRNSVFDELKKRDVLISLPYESFDPVVRLVEDAAADPDVLAIKQILYRTSADSPIVGALLRAAQAGKYVTVLVELKARFDEARNIEWARRLEEEGVQVIYGIKGLKTHAKICIVVRNEPEGIVRYCHFGTGNYNDKTARLYSDVGYMTRDPDLGADASSFFNAICGNSEPQAFLKLSAAPIGLLERLVELIDNEAERAKQGQKAAIMAKMNSLVEPEVISALYRASRAGVDIKLNVRGICCLRPGMKKHSKNIRVVSIVDRFLEHSRIFYFHQGGEEQVFISSADWMPRNLRRRIELMTPIDDDHCRERLVELLNTYFLDTVKASELASDGSYRRCRTADGQQPLRSQEALYRDACSSLKRAQKTKRTTFEPHRPRKKPSARKRRR